MATAAASGADNTICVEQSVLEEFFNLISCFMYDKAKDKVERERDSHKANFGSSWGVMLNSLSHFSLAEKMYTSLVYLGLKWFGRKENLRSSFQILLSELRKIEDQHSRLNLTDPIPPIEKLLSHLCGQLGHFVTARLKMIDFYEQMETMSGMKQIVFEDGLAVITEIIQSTQKNFHHPILAPLKAAFGLECDIISQLLQAQIQMSLWQFLPSLFHLQEAHVKLNAWGYVDPNKENRKLSFGSKIPAAPALYQWMMKLKSVLVAKFSLYFFEILSKQAPITEVKSVMSKSSIDFHSKLTTFQKKTDAFNVSLVFDVHGIEDLYHGSGYAHPSKYCDPPKGLELFPTIFSCPGDRPSDHWPNVVMMINDKLTDRTQFDKIVYFFDKKMLKTYYMTRIETRITLVVIFETKKTEKDSYIQNSLNEIASTLRLTRIFAALKPGTKM
ncbi:KICSTOR subunit 2-like [Tubulanus polymorphus]|uniref:KICSTOR subunit 2-like n=1 Tax=Tubulanus polymorphus TaxID=672921 RepID=UPI003DA6A0AF